MTRRSNLLSIAAALTLLAFPATQVLAQRNQSPASGVQQQQQQQQQQILSQQQARQMERSMERLHQLELQAGRLTRTMNQRVAQLGPGDIGLRQRSMQQLCDSITDLTQDMTRAMDRIHLNLRDPALVQDRDMQKDMDRLRLHIDDMAGPLEDALRTMERIQDRLHTPDGTAQ